MTCRNRYIDTGRSARLHSRSNGSNEIALAQFYTAVAQNVVSGGAMEIEVGHDEMHEIGLAPETHLVFTEREVDFTVLRAINVTGFEGLHERHGLSEPRLEISKSLFCVVMFRHFDAGEPRSGSFGEIRCNLDLSNERKHVGGEAVIE